MNQTTLLLASLITSLAVQSCPISGIEAQTSPEGNRKFLMPQNMAIDKRFQYLELKIDQQQKEEWTQELFTADVSQTMRVENLRAIELTEADLNNRPNLGIELIEF